MRHIVIAMFAMLLVSVALNLVFVSQLTHPKPLVVWNVPATITPNGYLFSTMFDTFKMYIDIHANSTVYVYVFTPSQFAEFYQSRGAIRSAVQSYQGTTINFTFTLSTGCAGYVWVVYNPSSSPIEVKPYVTAAYSPSAQATGVCSQT
ncbi:MAG: hypothetical protein QW688_01180 [Thermoprotei archaeon]